jgi:hypothetical protein
MPKEVRHDFFNFLYKFLFGRKTYVIVWERRFMMKRLLIILTIILLPSMAFANFSVIFENTFNKKMYYVLYWIDHPYDWRGRIDKKLLLANEFISKTRLCLRYGPTARYRRAENPKNLLIALTEQNPAVNSVFIPNYKIPPPTLLSAIVY